MTKTIKKLMVLVMVALISVTAAFAFERKGGYTTHWYNTDPEVVLTMPSVIDILSQEGLSPEDVTLEFTNRIQLEKAFKNPNLVEITQKMAEECCDAGCGQFVIGWFGEGVPEEHQYMILWLLDWPDGLKAYPFFYKITVNK